MRTHVIAPLLSAVLVATALAATQPTPIATPSPDYPAAAQQAGIEGTVVVKALVGRDGRVHDAVVTRSIPALDGAAVRSVRRWVFRPARAQGVPVQVWVAIPVAFRLHATR
jgi:bla regulator protein blaR1